MLLCVGIGLGALAPAASANTTVGDAYATVGSNSCTWTMGTAGIEKVVTFASGSFKLTSFKNKLASPAREYVQGSVVSPEFRVTWNGTSYTGNSGGWTCTSGTSSSTTVGGQSAVQVDIVLDRSTFEVTKHYIVFPSESLIREWTEYKNTDTSAHTLATPSFLEQHLMSTDIASGNVRLNYFGGEAAGYTNRATTLNAAYARTFDSYDNAGCVDSGSTPATCGQDAFRETSESYVPLFSLYNTSANDGAIMSFDYFGRWTATIGNSNGDASMSLAIPNYSSSLAAGATATSPTATVMTYKTDLDDMTNRLLDYQYRYLWDYTRSGYFAGVNAEGDWCQGTQWCGNWDQQGIRQKIFSLSDRHREIGTDVDWRDYGWWDVAGDWNGPDFKMTNDALSKSGIKSTIYYHGYMISTSSALYAAHPSWFATQPSTKSWTTTQIGDFSNPAFVTYMKNLLVGKADDWGDYQWRNDGVFMNDVTGSSQLAVDQNYRDTIKYFLDQKPGSSFFPVNNGGFDIGLDYMRYASLLNNDDSSTGIQSLYNSAILFPVDKLSGGDPGFWGGVHSNCAHSMWLNLAEVPTFFASGYNFNGAQGRHADTADAREVECARKIADEYHYMVAQGVAGRWVKTYHPTSSDTGDNWIQRVSQDGSKSLLTRLGATTGSSVTVYPKGLTSGTTYDVRYQFNGNTASRTGSDLMTNGITFGSGLDQGEIIYLNLAKHPGSALDTTAPTAPGSVAAAASTDVNYPGVDVTWTAGSDDNWISYYQVYRDGVPIGRVSKGRYYYDHTPGASQYSTYQVQTVDGAGTKSAMTASTPAHGNEAVVVDDPGLVYSGFTHRVDQDGSFQGTLSSSSSTSDSATMSFTGSAVTLYVKLGPDQGKAQVKIDGTTDATIDLYAPDVVDVSVPIYSKTWSSAGAHTITIVPDGTHQTQSSGNEVSIDGLQVTVPSQTNVEDSSGSVTYSGTWTHSTGVTGTSNSDISSSSSANAYAQYTFTSSRVRVLGRYCSACGEADVYIDGVYDGRIDAWGDRGAQVDRTVLYDRGFATSGTHTIKVVVLGKKNLGASGTTVYVDAFQTDNGGTSLNAAGLVDSAQGTSPTQSSTLSGGLASRAVDGNTDGDWAHNSIAHTNSEANAHWETDLGTSKAISSIELWNRTDCCGTRLSDYYVFASNRPFESTSVASTIAQPGVWYSRQTVQAGTPTRISVGRTARYVRVQLAGTDYLALAEVKVLTTGGSTNVPVNVALGTSPTQSTTLANSPAARAVDGSTEGDWYSESVSHTDTAANSWWQDDLGSSRFISTINVWNRRDCCGDRLDDFWVFVSDNPFTSTNLATTIAQSGVQGTHITTQAGSPTTIDIGRTGRYVRVQLNNTDYLALSEVQVYADPPASTTTYGGVALADSPTGFWRLADGSGSGTAADSSGNSHSGTVNGTVTFQASPAVTSEATHAATFDGSSGWIALGNPAAFQVGTGSIEAWIKTTNSDSNLHAIALKQYAYSLFVHNGKLVSYDWGGATERDSGVFVADGAWHHVVLTFQSGVSNGSTFYVDGVARGTTTMTVSAQTTQASISNGCPGCDTQFFPGRIEEVAFYNTALSAAKVLAHYNAR
jgi:hypothetical protein